VSTFAVIREADPGLSVAAAPPPVDEVRAS